MKAMEINTIGLEEISINETIITFGGIGWEVLLDYLLRTAAAGLAGYLAHKALAVPEYDGGELDPAICYG